MGKWIMEWTAEQYDKKYLNWGKNMYSRFTNYKPMWMKIIDWIDGYDKIADFGCGAGLFAYYVLEKDIHYSYGVDFSKNAIELAKLVNPQLDDKLFVGDMYEKETYEYDDYNVAVFLDVLEHLNDDKWCLKQIKSGTKVIMALPNFWSPDHVRVFQGEESVNRYADLVDIQKVDKWKNIWIVFGVKK